MTVVIRLDLHGQLERAAAIPTLVSNTDQTSIGSSANFHAQSFETGAAADGYTVSEVDVYLVSGSGRSTSVSIREDDGGEPGDLVATLTNPGTLTANSLNTFTASAWYHAGSDHDLLDKRERGNLIQQGDCGARGRI